MAPRPDPRAALTVSQLLARARGRLADGLADVWVRGEVSGAKAVSAGHVYFCLKDASAQVKVVLFRSRAVQARFRIEDGLELLARGELTVWEGRGELQLVAAQVEPTGLGAFALAFEQLEIRLAAEGLFEAGRKRPMPLLPRRIGVVSSPTGAALRDVLHVLESRRAGLSVLLAPVRVQGDLAAAEIAAAIDRLGRYRVDLILLARGGGSIEDLWPFNEEVVARAIARSTRPVMSAVGHEVDVTIADLVADVRAPTPTAAAELLAAPRAAAAARVGDALARMRSAVERDLGRRRLALSTLLGARALRGFEAVPARRRQRLEDLRARLSTALTRRLQALRGELGTRRQRLEAHDVRARLRLDRRRIDTASGLLHERLERRLSERRERLAALSGRLDALSPLAVLARGYAIVTADGGRVVCHADEVATGDRLDLRLAHGRLTCRVEGREAGTPAGEVAS